ncbi:hypothetical protein ACTL32_10100 [Planococcus sp. FY231025]|uniref:hypothetical protein n=1 Tax=Planococcus sp. FY231025 TaxID=3455699 RepID=UPI003F8E3BB4
MLPWLLIMIGLMLVVVLSNRFLPLWLKVLLGVYFIVVAAVFVNGLNRINEKYTTPLPDAYWDENSAWVYLISDLLFFPFICVLIFIYLKWVIEVRTNWAKALVLGSTIPAALIVFFFYFMFNFGYQP